MKFMKMTIKNDPRIYQDYYDKQKGLKEYQRKSKTIKYFMSRGFEYEKIIDIFDCINDKIVLF
jgi:regulatory protein